MNNKICIEGIDGSGKSVVAADMKEVLNEEGVTSIIYSPIRMAEERLGYRLVDILGCPNRLEQFTATLDEITGDCLEEAERLNIEVVIFDRHWMTLVTALSEIGELDPLEVLTNAPPAAMIRVNPDVASNRLASRGAIEDHEKYEELIRYRDLYETIAEGNFGNMHGIYRSDADVSVRSLSRAIISDMRFRR